MHFLLGLRLKYKEGNKLGHFVNNFIEVQFTYHKIILSVLNVQFNSFG